MGTGGGLTAKIRTMFERFQMPKIERCVRCGQAGRWLDSWLCAKCYGDPTRLAEQNSVESAAWDDYRAMRKMLRENYGWFGGWTRHETTEG